MWFPHANGQFVGLAVPPLVPETSKTAITLLVGEGGRTKDSGTSSEDTVEVASECARAPCAPLAVRAVRVATSRAKSTQARASSRGYRERASLWGKFNAGGVATEGCNMRAWSMNSRCKQSYKCKGQDDRTNILCLISLHAHERVLISFSSQFPKRALRDCIMSAHVSVMQCVCVYNVAVWWYNVLIHMALHSCCRGSVVVYVAACRSYRCRTARSGP